MSLKLYEIASEYRELMTLLENSDDEEVDADSFMLALDALETDFAAKATNIGCLIRELSAESTAISDTARSLYRRAHRLDEREAYLRSYLYQHMAMTGIASASDSRISISLKKNPASVQVDAPETLPLDYCRVIPEKIEPDKTAIRAALKAGVAIPGCALVQTQRLDIK